MKRIIFLVLVVALLVNVACSTMVGKPLRNSLGFNCLVEGNDRNNKEENKVEAKQDEEK